MTSELRRQAQPLLDHPLVEPTPVEVLRARASRARSRRRLGWLASTVAILLLVGVAIVVRQSAHRDGAVTAGPSATPLHAEDGEVVASGTAAGRNWTLQARLNADRSLRLVFRHGTTKGTGGSNVPPNGLVWFAVHGGPEPYTFVYGAVPAATSSVRITTLQTGTPITGTQAEGDPSRFGARFFVIPVPVTVSSSVEIEALDVGTRSLGHAVLALDHPQPNNLPSQQVHTLLRDVADRASATLGGRVHHVEAVYSPHHNDAVQRVTGDITFGPDQPVWIIQIDGENFQCRACSHPSGANIPPGNNSVEIVDATTFQVLDLSFGSGHKDLAKFGRVISLDR
jgi:hypothetical protein